MPKLFFLAAALSLGGLAIAQKPVASIKAGSDKVDIRDGDKFIKGQWGLDPASKPDVYKAEVDGKRKITFYTDVDSISFIVERNKQYNFNIIRGKDTCLTQINTVPYFYFDKKYIQKNRSRYSFEIPEVQELVHIIIALTSTGLADKNMVQHKGKYYEEVLHWFEKFKDEPVVAAINNVLEKGGYSRLKMDACGFYFRENKIVSDKNYQKLSWDGPNYVELSLLDLEKFALKTGFRKFYKEHQSYYQNLISLMEVQIPVYKQWKWLEHHFKQQYDHYRITFSPLVNGAHSTNRFIQDDFKQTVMFICGPIEQSDFNKKVEEGLMTRVVFTEIDHNYVNPVSDKYLKTINESFVHLDDWATRDALNDYSSTYAVFNEYMTWAVFTLYAKANFNQEDFQFLNNRVELQMSEWRGFKKFKEFNKELLALYEQRSNNSTIESLYPAMLNWCKKQ